MKGVDVDYLASKGCYYKAAVKAVGYGTVMEECRKKAEVVVLRFEVMVGYLCQGKVDHKVVVGPSDYPVHHLKKAVVGLVPKSVH